MVHLPVTTSLRCRSYHGPHADRAWQLLEPRFCWAVLIEAFALFVHYQLSVTPPIPEGDIAARASGLARFNKFVAQVGKAVASGKRTLTPAEDTP